MPKSYEGKLRFPSFDCKNRLSIRGATPLGSTWSSRAGNEGSFKVSMKIRSTRQVNGITIIDLSGRITLGKGGVLLRDMMRDLITRGQRKILLNLGDVTFIDSSGIGELVSAFTTVRNRGGELKLLNLTRKVHDLLAKLSTFFDVKGDEATAVASFK